MADLNDFAGDLETQLTCVICNDIFTEPRTLPCLHTFCFHCIKSWNETCQKERKPLKCPTCRAAVNVEGGDISNLPSSFTYNSLLQLFDAMKVMAGQQNQQQLPECVNCSKRSVLVGFCPQCEGLICGECINHHRTMNTLKRTHQATLWNEFKSENVNSYINNQALCKEKHHEKFRLEYYCQTCSKCICQKCATTKAHSTHEKVSIEGAAEDAKKLIRKDKELLNQLLVKYKKELELSNENMRRIQNEVGTAKTKVRSNTQDLIKILQHREEALIASLNDILVGHTTANDEEKGEINANIQQVTELKHQCETMQDKNLEHFILESYQKLQDVCNTIMERKSILSTKPVKRNSSVRYIPNPEVIPIFHDIKPGKLVESVTDPSSCSIESVSSVRCGFINQFSIVTRNSQGDVSYTNQGSIDVQIQDVDGNDVQTEVTETETGRFLVKYKAETPLPYKIIVRIGGKAIKNSPQNVDMIDAKAEFKPLRYFETRRASSPITLAVSERGEIAVVNNDQGKDCRVILFSADGEYLRDFCGEGPKEGHLVCPFGVVFNGDQILVSYNQDDCGCIKGFGFDGTYRRTLCKLHIGMVFTRMCTTSQSIACLCRKEDTKETFIKLFAKETGDYHHDIKLDVPNDGHGYPTFLAYDNNKYFVSFECKDSCVYVFGENGSLLFTFGEKGNKEGKFKGVRGLAVFGEDMLLVCDGNNHRVQVFTQGGHFVSSFGSRVSSVGQMIWPFDVVVTPDGRVFVLERYNKRVQVWR